MAFSLKDTLIVTLPRRFVFGIDNIAASLPGGVPPNPPTKLVRPEGWVDPPWADDVRMLLEVARARASEWNDVPQVEEQVRSYVDLALSVLHGPVDPARTQPRNLAELEALEGRLQTALESCRQMRVELGGRQPSGGGLLGWILRVLGLRR